MRNALVQLGISIFAGLALSSASAAERFPSRTMRVVTSSGGGASNLVSRLIAQSLPERIGHPVVVENRGGGVLAGEVVARAEPDGHTLLVYGNTLWLLPLMRRHMPYDPIRDFAPVILATRAAAVLVVHPSLSIGSVQAFVAFARKNPGRLNYASGGAGGIAHLSAEMFASMAGIDIVRIPFKGTGPGINALLGNHVQLMFGTWGATSSHVKNGQLRALAVTSAERFPLAPNIPTLAESGLEGYESTAMFGVFVPAKTPRSLIKKLNELIGGVLKSPAVRSRLTSLGAEVIGGSPEAFATAIRDDRTKMGKVIRARGIRDN